MSTALPLVVERRYHAPVEAVWQALTDPEQLKKWYFDLPGFRAEAGYQFRFEGGPPGRIYVHLCEVTEVVTHKVLAYSWRYEGYAGHSIVRFELIPEGIYTTLRLTHSGLESFPATTTPDLAAHNFEQGWSQILGASLPEYLDNVPQLKLERYLDAPRDLVFKAWTDPVHLSRWWGPAGADVQVLHFDLRPGGMFHYSMRYPSGDLMYGKFIYREISAPERLVWLNAFANESGDSIDVPFFKGEFPMHIYNVLSLTEIGNKTLLQLQGRPIEATEAQIRCYESMFPSMEQGFGGTFNQLVEYLATLS